MKLCVVLIFALVHVSFQKQEFSEVVDKYIEVVKMVQRPCIEETRVNPVIIHNILKTGDFIEYGGIKCFFKCIHMQLDLMDDNGKINATVLSMSIPVADPKVAKKVALKCKDIKQEDPCDTAFDLLKCVYADVKENFK